jgi:alpha-galactosidase
MGISRDKISPCRAPKRFRFLHFSFLALALWIYSAIVIQAQSPLAATPPMGWNSWNSYGLTIREPDVRANADWMAAHLKSFGWQYIVIDEGWYLKNPESNGKPSWQFTMSPEGLYLPAHNRFPSAAEGQGFKPLADYVHSLGLKFGIHIIHGIPREAVTQDLPIAGSSFYAKDAADQADVCYWESEGSDGHAPQKVYWNSDNYAVRSNAAGQAYYDSMARLYASWGVDLIKVDCISSPYQADEIRMISSALRRSGRSIVLSLSPGPTPISEAAEVGKYAQMWRISNDISDFWSAQGFNKGIDGQFQYASQWARYAKPGNWPDADMLPIGYLGPGVPGARETRLSRDEQQSLLTLWAIIRSPLMIGGNLPSMDPWTTSLLTNPDFIRLDQHSSGAHEVSNSGEIIVWTAEGDLQREQYVAIFNIGNFPQSIRRSWKELQQRREQYDVTNLWAHTPLGTLTSVDVKLAPHACVLFRLVPSHPSN